MGATGGSPFVGTMAERYRRKAGQEDTKSAILLMRVYLQRVYLQIPTFKEQGAVESVNEGGRDSICREAGASVPVCAEP